MTPDGLDFSRAIIHNSPDVRNWPITATITTLEFRPTGVHVEYTRNHGPEAWPSFRPGGWDGDLQSTLWIVLRIAGVYHASGCIQFWESCDQNGGPPEEIAANWYYAADRWAPMTGYQPAPGEIVGFLMTAGDARNNGTITVHERSNVVAMPFPVRGFVYTAPADPAPSPIPTPTPTPDPIVPPIPVPPSLTPVILDQSQYDAIMARFDRLDTALVAARADVAKTGSDLLKQLPAIIRKALTGR